MPSKNSKLFHPRAYRNIYVAILSLIPALLLVHAPVLGQQYGPEGPPFPGPPPPEFVGSFYLHSGVKFRVLKTVRFDRIPGHGAESRNLGTPAFGPNTDGEIFFPPTGGVTWTYSDGVVDALLPAPWTAALALAVAGSTTLDPGGLGHYGVAGFDLGSFLMRPWHPLASSTTDVAATTQIQFSGALNIPSAWTAAPSQIAANGTLEAEPVVFDPQLWTPYIEIGYQYSPSFDFLISASWFNIAETDVDNRPTIVRWSERRFIDTYQFRTTLPAGITWAGEFGASAGGQWSSATPPNAAQDYFIYPVGIDRVANTRPTRRFQENVLASDLPGTELLATKLTVDVIELKMGVRNWYPIWGLGRSGMSLGGIFAPMPYTVESTALVTVDPTAPALTDPDTGLPITVAGFQFAASDRKRDIRWGFGGFVGADLQLSAGPMFILTAAEYNWYIEQKFHDFSTVTVVDPSGYVLTLAGGFRF